MMAPSVSLLYLPSAILLGALHALEPGHAKTLTAAYLIGIKGTKRDALLLGLSVATTHSFVVVMIATIGLILGEKAFAGNAGHFLEMGSGVIVVVLGTWMLWRRWPRKRAPADHHHHASAPVPFEGPLTGGTLQIIDTPAGERMQCLLSNPSEEAQIKVAINRPQSVVEILEFEPVAGSPGQYLSKTAPAEPHEFSAMLSVGSGQGSQTFEFAMTEPHDHHHDHDHDHNHEDLDEEAHARAHAATMPEYVKQGGRPSAGQIIAFGAAGGMIPCPASITVMLMAVSVGKTALGFLTVLGFSVGLALTLVGMGMLVVTGLNRLGSSGRFEWVSKRAPILSAMVVIFSGLAALVLVH